MSAERAELLHAVPAHVELLQVLKIRGVSNHGFQQSVQLSECEGHREQDCHSDEEQAHVEIIAPVASETLRRSQLDAVGERLEPGEECKKSCRPAQMQVEGNAEVLAVHHEAAQQRHCLRAAQLSKLGADVQEADDEKDAENHDSGVHSSRAWAAVVQVTVVTQTALRAASASRADGTCGAVVWQCWILKHASVREWARRRKAVGERACIRAQRGRAPAADVVTVRHLAPALGGKRRAIWARDGYWPWNVCQAAVVCARLAARPSGIELARVPAMSQ